MAGYPEASGTKMTAKQEGVVVMGSPMVEADLRADPRSVPVASEMRPFLTTTLPETRSGSLGQNFLSN